MSDLDATAKLKAAKKAKVELILTFFNKKTGKPETINGRLLDIFPDNGSATRLELERQGKEEKKHSTILYFSSELGEIRTIREAASKRILYPI